MDDGVMKRVFKALATLTVLILLGALAAFVTVRLTLTRDGVVVPDWLGRNWSRHWKYRINKGSH